MGEVYIGTTRVSSSWIPPYEAECEIKVIGDEEKKLSHKLRDLLKNRSPEDGEVLRVSGYESRVKLIPRPVDRAKGAELVLTIMVNVRRRNTEAKDNSGDIIMKDITDEEIEKEEDEMAIKSSRERKELVDDFKRAFKVTDKVLKEKGWGKYVLEFVDYNSVYSKFPDRWINDWTNYDSEGSKVEPHNQKTAE